MAKNYQKRKPKLHFRKARIIFYRAGAERFQDLPMGPSSIAERRLFFLSNRHPPKKSLSSPFFRSFSSLRDKNTDRPLEIP